MTTLDQQPILITGASGFTGEHLARYFSARKRRVAGTWLSTPPEIPRAEVFPFDITDRPAWNRLLRDMKPQAIIHCAAQTSIGWCEENPREARATNLEGTEALCAAVADRAPETPVLYFSTDLVFDGTRAPYREDAAAKPLSRYGSLKWAAEEAVLSLLRGTVLRSALIYGVPTSRRGSFLGWMVDTLKKGNELTLFEDEYRTPVFVEDLARAVELLLEADLAETAGEIFHAGGAERLSRVRMGQMVCEVFDLPRQLIRPLRQRDLAGGELRPPDVSLSSGKLLSLGWNQISFRDGLLRCREQWNSIRKTLA